jgi:very-short-patch-repair endonuclease
MLGSDAELASLFRFNWFVETVRGSRPKVDWVWMDGRLVVELDGYPDHATRRAFIGDRQRDYELLLSGFTVLRLANDEIAQDCGRAIEKIRDLVRFRRSAAHCTMRSTTILFCRQNLHVSSLILNAGLRPLLNPGQNSLAS